MGPSLAHPRRPVIRSVEDLENLRNRILDAADRTAAWLRDFSGSSLDLLRSLRFQTVGYDPLTGTALNTVEQLNQTFTILVSLRAVEQLLELHPDAGGFKLALATSGGRDIESVEPNLVAAEVFAATHPGSNQKLRKDLARLAADPAQHRYVFFAAPGFGPGRQLQLEAVAGVQVRCVEL